MINILTFWSDIGFSIKQALRTFSCNIAAVLYSLIVDLYNVFMYTARAEILESSFIQRVYNKVGMILGIFMVFKLSFSLIQSLVDPNKFTDEKNGFGGIIKRSVISIVLLGVTPSLFRMAFDIQNLIVGSANNTDNIIYKMVVGSSPSNDAESFGHVIASELYFGFYTENKNHKLNDGLEIIYPDSGGVNLVVHDYAYLKSQIVDGNMSFKDTVDYLSITSGGEYVIDWNGLLAIGFAGFMIYILIAYCISVATRVIQLAYLQLIAPVPILSYISDPEGSFKNWTKQCMTTYLDLFIRLAIIYFIITVSTQILEAVKDSNSILYGSTGLEEGSSTMFWVKIFLIIGLLMFGKRVPELLKDLFPNFGGGAASIGFGIKKPKDMIGDIPLIGGATNKVLGYAGGLGKRFGKFAWKQTGSRGIDAIKNAHNRRKEDNNAYKEENKKDREAKNAWDKYGESFEAGDYAKAFESSKDKNGEYAESYDTLEKAKKALKDFDGDTNSAEYRRLLSDKEKAEKNHNVNRDKYKDLARREDMLKRYNNRHPNQNQGNVQGNGVGQNPAPPQNNQGTQSQRPNTQNSNNITYGTDDGNPYETGHSQFTTESMSRGNDNITYGTDDGNPYETGHSQFTATSGGNNSDEDDNPYVNPNYYNDNSQNTNNSNDNDEFDGSNYY